MWVVSRSRLQLVESQADALNANLGGTSLDLGTNAGDFSLSEIDGRQLGLLFLEAVSK
jgi:hypothetical protein